MRSQEEPPASDFAWTMNEPLIYEPKEKGALITPGSA